MHPRGEGRAHRAAGGPPTAVIPLSRHERRIIFQEMVRAEMEAGLLRHSKRRQLLRYSAKLGIPRTEAGAMIAEVLHGSADDEALRWLAPSEIQDRLESARRCQRTMTKLLAVTVAATMLNLWIIHWIF